MMGKMVDLLTTNELFVGVDSGNTATKVSYLNIDGAIESFAIPTVMAPAPATAAEELSGSKLGLSEREVQGEDVLHVQILSNALPVDHRRNFYFVGRCAMDREQMVQPTAGVLKSGNELMTVTTLTSLAIAALRNGKQDVRVNYSGGVPIGEYQQVGQSAMTKLLGQHTILFLDGPFKDQRVSLDIYDGTLRVEGVNSVLGLDYDIRHGELLTTPLVETFGIQTTYALADLGAGTVDKAYYKRGQIDKNVSTNAVLAATESIGTNSYIDQLMHQVLSLDAFTPIRRTLGDAAAAPYRNREEFVEAVIAPGVQALIQGGEAHFFASWARVRHVDITDLVLNQMENYGKQMKKELDHFWYVRAKDAERFGLVGGGVLFGYTFFKDLKEYTLPSPEILNDAAFITSRSYLIARVAVLEN